MYTRAYTYVWGGLACYIQYLINQASNVPSSPSKPCISVYRNESVVLSRRPLCLGHLEHSKSQVEFVYTIYCYKYRKIFGSFYHSRRYLTPSVLHTRVGPKIENFVKSGQLLNPHFATLIEFKILYAVLYAASFSQMQRHKLIISTRSQLTR